MKKQFALLRRKVKPVRKEKMPGRAEIFSVTAGLLIAAFFTGMIYTKQELYAQEETQKHLAQEVFRFHVLANSDSEKDQNLKLQVRDAVLDYMKEELSEEPEEKQCLKQTVQWARTHTDEIRAIGEKTVYLAVTYSAVKFIHLLNLFYFLFPKIPANLKLCICCHPGIFFFRQYLF